MSTAAAAVTPDDLLRMGSAGKGYELVNGELREVEVSTESSHVAGTICTLLTNHCKARQPGWVFPEGTGYTCFADDDGRLRKPDTSYLALDRYTAVQYRTGGWITVVPDLAVEVVSPNDTAGGLEEKRYEWLDAGAREVWIVHPTTRTVHTYRAGAAPAEYKALDTLTTPLLPGFRATVAELFAIPGEAPPVQ